MNEYRFKRELKSTSDSWNSLILPDDIFEKISPDFADIRIIGVGANQDTVEAPYLIRIKSEENSSKVVSFKIINRSKINDSYYFTFEIPFIEQINHIELHFEQKNFDWQIHLEGSNNQNLWFTILDGQRILSIKNDNTNFEYTKLIFPDAKYRFYSVKIDSKEQPELSAASVSLRKQIPATHRSYKTRFFDVIHNKNTKQTEIDFELTQAVPVSFVHVDVISSYDYYRPITIKYVNDSLKSEKGWTYSYRTLVSGTLNSIERSDFTFSSTVARKFKIVIENHDNQALNIRGIEVKGFEHEIITRLDENITYHLVYGNNAAEKPNYDLAYFVDKIPNEFNAITLGSEQEITKPEVQAKEPLFVNQVWLWIVIACIVSVLGWFTLKMMKKA